MPIIDVQVRMRELGRIRIGQKGAKGQPQKLDRFRVTSADRTLVERVAALYGGAVTPWTGSDGREQFEVVTDTTRIPVLLPPQPVTQWMELWSGGGCQRRCDGQTETLTDSPCLCKANDDEVCKPTTRLNVVLRDVPGLGVFRLETHGWNAAQELPGAAAFAAQAGGMIPAHLTLEERVSRSDGQTRRFMVPGLDVEVTPAQLLAGQAPAAVTAAPVAGELEARDFVGEVAAASSREQVTAVWKAAGSPQSGPLVDACKARTAELSAGSDGPVDDADFDGLWLSIVAAAPEDWTTDRLEEEFAAANGGTMPGSASAAELRGFLASLKAS